MVHMCNLYFSFRTIFKANCIHFEDIMSHFVALAGALTLLIVGKGHEKSSASSGKRNTSSSLTEYNSQTTCFAIGVG